VDEKLSATMNDTCIKAHQFSVVILRLPVKKAEIHKAVRNSNHGDVNTLIADYQIVFSEPSGTLS
jgi:hypothetical protein